MAEIEMKSKKGKNPFRKLSGKMVRVDLTPMVDLGFLLISFFVFTTTLSKPKVMDIKTPFDTIPGDQVCNSCALTVLLGEKGTVYYYPGEFEKSRIVKTDLHSIRTVIQRQKQALQQAGRDKSQFSLIIKCSDETSFGDFIDITDEVTINDVTRYYIDELTATEKSEMQL